MLNYVYVVSLSFDLSFSAREHDFFSFIQSQRDDHQKHTLYFTVRIFFVQLILLFLVLACYGGQMLWNLRREKMRKKRILTLMSKKISFSDVDVAKASKEAEEEEEEVEEGVTKVEDHIE